MKEDAACVEERRRAYKILVRKSQGKNETRKLHIVIWN
jgi:hypothetical protein